MPLKPRPFYPKGEVVSYPFESSLLKNNFLGDPFIRDLRLYYPADYTPERHYPLLVDLAPYTNSGQGRSQWRAFGESVPDRLNRLIGTGALAPCVVAFPDTMTRFGGNQFVNSSVMGPWEDHINHELLPFIEETAACGGTGQRACYGKSSGGYGALYFGLRSPEIWSAVACHSGDIAFDLVYLSEFPKALMDLARLGGSIEKFLEEFEHGDTVTGRQIHTLMLVLGMAASYDPDPEAPCGIRLPVDPETCELIPERWARWEAFDPLTLVETYGENLKTLKGLFLDCGAQDPYHLQYGARRFTKKLREREIPHVYEEFEGTHSGIDHRLDRSLPFLVKSLGG